jgi:DNA-directed RNA polymerase subunit RPC12/RpoP
MNLAISCARCGKSFTVTDELAGRQIRCQACGQIRRIPTRTTRPSDLDRQPALDVYSLAPESPAPMPVAALGTCALTRNEQVTSARHSRHSFWPGLVRAGVGESSLLERESLGLIALSAADLLVTYALLRQGPAFYESNPVAQWFFLRWNIAGMALFKFGTIGAVVVIGEIVERNRPGWGRGLLLVSCLATAAVVVYGLRLLIGHVG